MRIRLGQMRMLLELALLGLAHSAASQTADNFNPGADSMVTAFAIQADGKILVGGSFGALGGQGSSGLARLNADGTPDPTFSPGVGGSVMALAAQADGRIVVGGAFSSLGGQPRVNLGRLNSNGTVDPSFNPGASGFIYASVRSLIVQADGKILVGGAFTSLAGQAINCLGRLNPDGSLDASFTPNPGNDVYAVALQPDGKILVGGLFNTLCGQTRNSLGRLNANGSLDATFNPGAIGTVTCLAVQADGKVLVGGAFSSLVGQARQGIGRINADGTLDSTFNPGVDTGATSPMLSTLAVQANGQIIVGGAYTTLGGQPRFCLGRLNADGSPDAGFDPGVDHFVWAVAVQNDGKILVGGQFSTLGGQPRKYLGRLNPIEPATENLVLDGSTITWSRSGSGPEVWGTTFEASTNGSDWIALGTATRTAGGWRQTGVLLGAGATFRAQGCAVGGDGNGSSWWVEATTGPLAISQQPLSRTNNAGTLAGFTVVAAGTGPVNYQWRKGGLSLSDGGSISGAHAATLVLSNVFGADVGGYSVVLSNASGTVTSRVASLSVVDPFIRGQPVSRAVNAGQTTVFSVTAGGTVPLNYQWRKDGTNIVGATAAALTLTNVQWVDRGSYDVVVSNAVGQVTSAIAALKVNLGTADSFNPGANGYVHALAEQVDAKLLVGGRFTNLCGQARYYLGRLNPDGSLDSEFVPAVGVGTYTDVAALLLQPNGKIVVGGQFTNLCGQVCSNLGRLNFDGTLDPGFNASVNAAVSCLALQADGRILVGGGFTTLSRQSRAGLARLNADGSLDQNFNPALGGVPTPSVSSLAIQPDGKILLVGNFLTVGGQLRSRIARINAGGTVDTTFNPGAGLQALCLALQADGKILVGGNFSTLGGQPRNCIGRLNPNGTVDPTFNPGASWSVMSMVVQTDGKIVVSGAFASLAGQPRSYLGRLNPDGTLDPSFDPGSDGIVDALALQADGKLLVGGTFSWLGGERRNCIGRIVAAEPATDSLAFDDSSITWQRAGTRPELWRTSFQSSTNGVDWVELGAGARISGGWQLAGLSLPNEITVRARGYVGGAYFNGSSWFVDTISGFPILTRQPLSRTNPAGTAATFSILAGGTPPLGYQWRKDGRSLEDDANTSGAHGSTLTLSNVFGGDAGAYSLVLSNAFGCVTSRVALLTVIDPIIVSQPVSVATNVGWMVAFRVAAVGTPPLSYQWRKNGEAIAGATDATLSLRNVQATDAGIYDVVVTNVFGSVISAGARLTLMPSLDLSFHPAPNGSVYALAVQPDGKLLLGGAFSALQATPRSCIARVNPDGTLDPAFNPGASGYVYALAIQTDGRILAGGTFWTLAGQTRSYLGRVNPEGTIDPTFNPAANSTVNALVVQPDNRVLVAGAFTLLGGQPCNRIGRLDPSGVLDSDFNSGANGPVSALAMQADGSILVGGSFTTLAGQARTNLGRLTPAGTLDAEFHPVTDGPVYALAVQADGKIVLGGAFARLNGQTRNQLGRLNADGTVDTSFNTGAGFVVYSLVLQTDGKLLVGGSFTMVGGVTRKGLARLNPDGSLDPTFNPGADGTVYGLGLQADGGVLAVGSFGALGGFGTFSYVSRLSNTDPATQSLMFDGATIRWMRGGTAPEIWGATFDGSTNAIDWFGLGAGSRTNGGWICTTTNLPSDVRIRARGFLMGAYNSGSSWFVESFGGPPAIVIQPASRLNNAGTLVTFAIQATGSAPLAYQWVKDGIVLNDGGQVSGARSATLKLDNVSKSDVGGYWVVVSNTVGSVTSVVAQLTVSDPFISSQPLGQTVGPGQAATLSVTPGGTAPWTCQWRKEGAPLAGATNTALTMTNVQVADAGRYDVLVSNTWGSITSSVALLTVNLVTADGFNPVADTGGGGGAEVVGLALQADGKILAGGMFHLLNGQPRAYLGRLNPDGTLDGGFNPEANNYVNVLAIQPDGKILVGGAFTALGGQARGNLARLDAEGNLDALDAHADGQVNCLALQPDGRILVGGAFRQFGGRVQYHLGRLNPDGVLDGSFNPSPDAAVHALAIQPDGKILVGGAFATLGGAARNHVARLNADGTLDGGFDPGADGSVDCFALQPNGKILVGGWFTNLRGLSRKYLGRLNADGSLDTGFNPDASDSVSCIVLQSDGKIVVGGRFWALAGQPRSGLGRLNPDGTLDPLFGPSISGPNASVWSLGLQADGSILVGGWFTVLAGQARTNFGRLNNTDPAVQLFGFKGAAITWWRSGTAPEVWRTSYDVSTNGIDWTSLGSGTRVPGGWQVISGPLTTQSTVRARGYVAGGGYYNGSSWFVESLLALDSRMPPVILGNDPGFGQNSNHFAFEVGALIGQTVVIETSTNLLDWLTVSSNFVETGVVHFDDPAAEVSPRRFYRARLQ